MVTKGKKIHGADFFGSIFFSPIVFVGCFAAAAFYIFCLFEHHFSFLPWSLSIAALSASYMLCVRFFPARFLKKRGSKNLKFVIAGVVIGFVSFLRLLAFYSPVMTLADAGKTESVQIRLNGEPVPAGKKYYAVHAALLSCRYKNGVEFSAKGTVKAFIPSGIITQNNAGAVSLYKSSKKNASRIFARGVILSVKGRFMPKKTGTEPALFFADPEIPEFSGWSNPFSAVRARLRFALMRLLADWGAAGGLMLALLSANKDFLEEACSSAFRNAGLAHILALSGMHVSLISLAAVQAGSIFGKKSRAVKISLAAVVFFVWFAGSAPSLNRALGMMSILLAGKSLGLKPHIFSILCAMLTVHLLFKPEEALSLGFMLSYGALAGILLFGTAVFEILNGKIPPKLLGGISASLAAQAFTAPVVVFKIGVLAPVGIIASIVLSPFVSVFLIAGMAGIAVSLVLPQLGFVFSYGLNALYTIIVVSVQAFANFPLLKTETPAQKAVFSIIPFAAGLFFIYYAAAVKARREAVP